MSCPDCYKGSVHDHGEARGHEETIHGLRTYVAAPSKNTESKSAILFVCDVFGLDLINNKILADRYSESTGCRVLVPDVFPGGAMSVAAMSYGEIALTQVAWYNVLGLFKRLWNLGKLLRYAIPFMLRANPKKAYPIVLNYARAMKADLPPGGKLGVCGFCWGGYSATRMCVETAEPESSKPLVDAHFNAHPSLLKLPDMVIDAVKTFRVPYSCAVAEKDMMLNQKEADKIEVQLRREVGAPDEKDYEFVVYKDCKHGFAIRADPTNDKVEAQGMEDAAVQAINWFNKFLNQ